MREETLIGQDKSEYTESGVWKHLKAYYYNYVSGIQFLLFILFAILTLVTRKKEKEKDTTRKKEKDTTEDDDTTEKDDNKWSSIYAAMSVYSFFASVGSFVYAGKDGDTKIKINTTDWLAVQVFCLCSLLIYLSVEYLSLSFIWATALYGSFVLMLVIYHFIIKS